MSRDSNFYTLYLRALHLRNRALYTHTYTHTHTHTHTQTQEAKDGRRIRLHMIAVFTLTPKAQWHPLKTHFSTLQHTCNTLQRSLYSCPSKLALQGGLVQPYTLPLKHMSTHCSALETLLQHTATSPYTCCKVTHCNTLQVKRAFSKAPQLQDVPVLRACYI